MSTTQSECTHSFYNDVLLHGSLAQASTPDVKLTGEGWSSKRSKRPKNMGNQPQWRPRWQWTKAYEFLRRQFTDFSHKWTLDEKAPWQRASWTNMQRLYTILLWNTSKTTLNYAEHERRAASRFWTMKKLRPTVLFLVWVETDLVISCKRILFFALRFRPRLPLDLRRTTTNGSIGRRYFLLNWLFHLKSHICNISDWSMTEFHPTLAFGVVHIRYVSDVYKRLRILAMVTLRCELHSSHRRNCAGNEDEPE